MEIVKLPPIINRRRKIRIMSGIDMTEQNDDWRNL